MKRFLVCAIIASGFAVSAASAHECGVVQIRTEGRAVTQTEGIRFSIAETQTFRVCNEGDPVLNAASSVFTVYVDDVAVCSRTDVDVSVDPFGFGAGLHMSPEDAGACAIGVSMSSIENPTTPRVEESGLQEGGVGVATNKSVIAQHDIAEDQLHGLRLGDDLHEIADGNAVFIKKIIAAPNAD